MVTKDGRQVDNLQDASVDDLLYEVKLANAIRYAHNLIPPPVLFQLTLGHLTPACARARFAWQVH
jgi:hypothetical protein